MPFWTNRKKDDLLIQCPACGWEPDGGKYWACSCGHVWNTFATHGKCPKCKKQWEETKCIGCRKTTPHGDWYKTKDEIELYYKSLDQVLLARKRMLEARLIASGLRDRRIDYAHLSYIDHTTEAFLSPYDAGCRMIILYAVTDVVHNPERRSEIVQWLKDERIWSKVSPDEITFFEDPNPAEELRIELSWRIEGALTLGWCLNKIQKLHSPEAQVDQKTFDEFKQSIPELGDPLQLFMSKLEYRSLAQIHEENILNEMLTSYFRDLLFNGEKDTTRIDRGVSFERHKVLNWLRTSDADAGEVDGKLWDNADTST